MSSAYLVFDEIHLYEPETALATTLEMLTWLNGRTPFLIMTATMSSAMTAELARLLNPTSDPCLEMVIVAADEVAGAGHRTIHTSPQPLTAAGVLRRHRGRTIVVCNTVARAQLIYQRLLAWGRTEDNTLLLHSRFKTIDRERITREVIHHFERDADGEDDIILMATQVVEVGLDISCDVLHTEVAPASSLIQRSGRCARFPGEEGKVYVYPLQENQSRRVSYVSYLPYDTGLSQHTLSALANYEGVRLDYKRAGALVDDVHTAADEGMLMAIELGRAVRREQMRHTLFGMISWRIAREQLIRKGGGLRFMLTNKEPASAKDSFSIPRALLVGLLLRGVQVLWRRGNDGIAEWRVVRRSSDFERGELFALAEGDAHYSPMLGLRVSPTGGYACRWQPRIGGRHGKV